MTEEEFQKRFPPGMRFEHCGRECVVMRYVDGGEAYHTARALGMHYQYSDCHGHIRSGVIRDYRVIEAQNHPMQMEAS